MPNDKPKLQPIVLVFMSMPYQLRDGTHSSDVRCNCLTQANLRAIVKDNEVIEAGCPVCWQQVPCEITTMGGKSEIGFFRPGTQVIG